MWTYAAELLPPAAAAPPALSSSVHSVPAWVVNPDGCARGKGQLVPAQRHTARFLGCAAEALR